MKQGDIYLVTLDPVVGSEQAKTRPCVIISTNIINDFAQTVTVAPMSSQIRKKPFAFHVKIDSGVIKLEHLRTVDKSRLVENKGKISFQTMQEIKQKLQLYFD